MRNSTCPVTRPPAVKSPVVRARQLHTSSVTAAGPTRPELTHVADFYYVKAFVHTYYARSAWHHVFNAQ